MVRKPNKMVPNGRAPRFFMGNVKKIFFLPRGSILSFEGGILLSISLGMAVRIFWSALEEFPKSASGKILGATFWVGDLFVVKHVPKNMVLWRNGFVVGF